MKILYVCHRFPFPPKRGGKIRPFNMIRHLSRERTRSRVLARARREQEAKEGEGWRSTARRFEMGRVRNPVQVMRMIARLPTATPSSMGYFYSPRPGRRVRELLAREHFDLIFVHCSSVAQYVEGVRGIPKILDFGDMDSQKWLEYARYKPFPAFAGLSARRHQAASARRSGSRAASTCARRRRAPSGKRSRLRDRRCRRIGSPTAWTANTSPRRTSRTTPTRSLRRPHGLLPEPGVHVRLLRDDAAAAAGAAAGPEARHRRRRSVAGGAAARADCRA